MFPTGVLLLIVSLLVSVNQAALLFDDRSEILDLHNQLREEHNAPALKWSLRLAIESKTFVNHCDFYRAMNHRNSTNNVAQGYAHWNDTVLGWYKSQKYYSYKDPKYNNKAGPFIAMIWESSTHIGCASTDCGKGVGRLYQCEYYPSIPVELIFDKQEYKKNIAAVQQPE